jgi:hypothetical protein
MKRSEAQALRAEIVSYGTRERLKAMTDDQRDSYDRARETSRNAMRNLANEREDLAVQFGGLSALDNPAPHLAVDHDIPESAERSMRSAAALYRVVRDLPEGWYRFGADNTEARYGWCESTGDHTVAQLIEAVEDWLNNGIETRPYQNYYSAEWIGGTDDTEYAEGRKLVDYDGLLVTADSTLEDFARELGSAEL